METCNCDVCTKKRGEPYYKTEELQKRLSKIKEAESRNDPAQQPRAITRETPHLDKINSSGTTTDVETDIDPSTNADDQQQEERRKNSSLSRRKSFIGKDRLSQVKSRRSDGSADGNLTKPKPINDESLSDTDLANSHGGRRFYVGDAKELRRKPSSTFKSAPTNVPGPVDGYYTDLSRKTSVLETAHTRSGRSVRQMNHYNPVNFESDDSAYEPSRPKKKRRVSNKRSIPADAKKPKSKKPLVKSGEPRSPSDAEDDNQVQLLLGTPLSSELSDPDLDLQYP